MTDRQRKVVQLLVYGVAVLGLVVGLGAMKPARVIQAIRSQAQQDLRPRQTLVCDASDYMSVKTGVTRTATPISGTFKLSNQRDSGDSETCGPTWSVAAGGGNVVVFLSRIYYDNDAMSYCYVVPYMDPPSVWFFPPDAQPSFGIGEIGYAYGIADSNETTGPSGTWPGVQVAKLSTGTNSIELNWSMTFGCQRLRRSRTSSPGSGRDASPVYAQETSAVDGWEDVDHPWSYDVTIGSISWKGTQAWTELVPDEWGWWPYLSAPGGVQAMFVQKDGLSGNTYAETTLQIDGADLNFTGGTKTYEEFTLTGDGPKITLAADSNGSLASQATWSVVSLFPLIVNWSGLSCKKLGSGDALDVQVSGGLKADPRYPVTMGWPTTPGPE
jgi:hypothetical protein